MQKWLEVRVCTVLSGLKPFSCSSALKSVWMNVFFMSLSSSVIKRNPCCLPNFLLFNIVLFLWSSWPLKCEVRWKFGLSDVWFELHSCFVFSNGFKVLLDKHPQYVHVNRVFRDYEGWDKCVFVSVRVVQVKVWMVSKEFFNQLFLLWALIFKLLQDFILWVHTKVPSLLDREEEISVQFQLNSRTAPFEVFFRHGQTVPHKLIFFLLASVFCLYFRTAAISAESVAMTVDGFLLAGSSEVHIVMWQIIERRLISSK